jgi:hypothetical protein
MQVGCSRKVTSMPYVGCLTARRRNDPKQAGLSKSMPGDGRFAGAQALAGNLPHLLPSGMGIDDESDQVN